MTSKWVPTSGDFLCPGKIILTVDDKGIVIKRGRRALATTEWPGENIRVCELVEEPDIPTTVSEEVYHALGIILRYSQPNMYAELREMEGEYYEAERVLRKWALTLKKENRE